MRLSKALEGFIEDCRTRRLSSYTVSSYEGDGRAFVGLVNGLKGDLVSAFTEETVEAYFKGCVAKGNIISTLLAKRSSLNEFAQYCLRKRYLAVSPMVSAPKYRLPHRIPRRFTTSERERLMALTETHRLVRRRVGDGSDRRTKSWEPAPLTPAEAVARAVLYYSAIRVGTLVRLRVEDIHLDVGSDVGSIRVISKGNREIDVPIVPELARVLTDYIRDHTDWHPKTFLFHGRQNRPWSVSRAERMVQGWGRAARVGQATPHRFRHTAAMELLETGATLEETQEFLGHASIATTQIYRRTTSAAVLAAAMRRAQQLAET